MNAYPADGIGIVFDIDLLGGGFYGDAAWRMFAGIVPASGLRSCLLIEGDTAATLAGLANEFCIGVYGAQETINLVRTAFERAGIESLSPLRRFIERPKLDEEPLVDKGVIDSAGRLVTESWTRFDHDLSKASGWGYAPREAPNDLGTTLRAELNDLQWPLAHRAARILENAEQTGDYAQLDRAIELLEHTVEVTPTGHPDLIGYLSVLGAGRWMRFRRMELRADLNAAVTVSERALAIADVDNPYRAATLSVLSPALLVRFQQTDAAADLDAAIAASVQAVNAAPDDYPDRAGLVSNVGVGLRARFQRTGELADLDAAIDAGERAVNATREDDGDDLALYHSNLGEMLLARFERTDALPDLDAGITASGKATSATATDHPRYVARLIRLGRVLTMRFERAGVMTDLDAAIETMTRAVAAKSTDQFATAEASTILGTALLSRYRRYHAVADLDAAVAACQQAMNAVAIPDDGPRRARLLFNLGSALRLRFERTREVTDLNAAINACEQAVNSSPADHPDRPGILTNLGAAMLDRFERTGALTPLDAATAAFEEAVNLTPTNDPERPLYLSNFAVALQNHFERTGALAHLDIAIEKSTEAVRITSADDPRKAQRLSILGAALLTRSERNRRPRDLDDAITVSEQAVAASKPTDPAYPKWLSNLGAALRARYDSMGGLADLDAAIDALQQAVAAIPEESPSRPRSLSTLAAALCERFEHTRGFGQSGLDLKNAIMFGKRAVATPTDDPDRSKWLGNLGSILETRYRWSGDVGDLNSAIKMRREAVAIPGVPPRNLAGTAHAWAKAAASAERWAEAVEGFEKAIKVLDQVVPRSLTRADQEHLLGEMGDLASDAAACCLRMGSVDRAVELFEQGRVVLLRQALDSRPDLDAVRRLYPHLAESFVDLASALEKSDRGVSELLHPDGSRRNRERREIVTRFDQTIAEIRAKPGFETFLDPPGLPELAPALAGRPMVLLIVSQFGSSAVILTRSSEATGQMVEPSAPVALGPGLVGTHVPLDTLTADELRRRVDAHLAACAAYKAGRSRKAWSEWLSDLTSWLWTAVVGPVLKELSGASQVVFVPGGLLGLLPLHAAWTADPATLSGRRYALDQLAISYAPSGRALLRAHEVATRVTWSRLLAVVGPGLPAASLEVGGFAAATGLGPIDLLLGEKATPIAFRDHAQQSAVLHLACHGWADLYDPLESGLQLAGGTQVVLRQIMTMQLQVRLAILSACETALAGTELPDESIGLPTGLLQAGVAGVVASQWLVPDMATAMLMTEFARQLQGGKVPPILALRQAQQWLRDTTNNQKREHWRTALRQEPRLPDDVVESFLDDVRFGESEDRDHSDLSAWGAFTHTGA